MADPGFSVGGGGCQPTILPNILEKIHEIILVRNDPPMITSDKLSNIYFKQAYEIVILPLSRYL